MRTTQRKGDTAVAQAIASFTRLGWDVSIPITESAAYDLIIDTEEGIKRVQVRYAHDVDVDLRCIHSNSRGYVVKKTKADSYDWLYVLNQMGDEFLVKKCFEGRRSFKPTNSYLLK